MKPLSYMWYSCVSCRIFFVDSPNHSVAGESLQEIVFPRIERGEVLEELPVRGKDTAVLGQSQIVSNESGISA